MENYTIHRLEQETFEVLIPLMQDCFGMDVDISYFKWKYIDNPDGFVRGYYAKSINNEVAAYYGVIPQMISYFGEKKLIYQSCDTMTHSRHRRKGLFQLLAKHCYNELEVENKLFVIGFGGNESTPGFLKFGWKHLFNFKNYFYPTLFSLFSRKNEKYIIKSIIKTDLHKIEHLFSLNKSECIHTVKSFEKFFWRINNPFHFYKVLVLSSASNSISSYVVYYTEKSTIQLIDYYFESISQGRQLINYLIKQENKKQSIKGILAFCQDNGEWSVILKKIGFISNPFSKGPLSYKTPFITFTDHSDYIKIKSSIDWNLSPFDHDSI